MREVVAKGSFFEVGYQLGEACKEDVLKMHEWLFPHLLQNTTIGSFERMREVAMEYANANGSARLKARMFLAGSAEGVGISLDKAAIGAYSDEILSEFVIGEPPSKCTTFVVDTEWGALMGHNEDEKKEQQLYWHDLTFDGHPQMVGAGYIGMWPGMISLNSRRVATLNNSFWLHGCRGRSRGEQQFLAAIARSLPEAVKHLTQQPVGLPSNYTVADGRSGKVLSLEVANKRTAYKAVSNVEVGPGRFVHTNHVLRLRLKDLDPCVVAGNHSLARLAELEALPDTQMPRNPPEMLALLSKKGKIWFRTSEEYPDSRTIASFALLPEKGEIFAWDANVTARKREHYFKF